MTQKVINSLINAVDLKKEVDFAMELLANYALSH